REKRDDDGGETRIHECQKIRPPASKFEPCRSSARVNPSDSQSKGALTSVSSPKNNKNGPARCSQSGGSDRYLAIAKQTRNIINVNAARKLPCHPRLMEMALAALATTAASTMIIKAKTTGPAPIPVAMAAGLVHAPTPARATAAVTPPTPAIAPPLTD